MPYKDQDKWNAWNKRRCRDNTEVLQKLKDIPCPDCGYKYPHYVMEFDHVPERGPKKFNIGAINNRKITAPGYQKELEKCDIICANCHKVRTYNRRQRED